MARMRAETEREFLRQMASLAGQCVANAQTEADREFYGEQRARWLDRLEQFEARTKNEEVA